MMLSPQMKILMKVSSRQRYLLERMTPRIRISMRVLQLPVSP
jgi:hypothetical protein